MKFYAKLHAVDKDKVEIFTTLKRSPGKTRHFHEATVHIEFFEASHEYQKRLQDGEKINFELTEIVRCYNDRSSDI